MGEAAHRLCRKLNCVADRVVARSKITKTQVSKSKVRNGENTCDRLVSAPITRLFTWRRRPSEARTSQLFNELEASSPEYASATTRSAKSPAGAFRVRMTFRRKSSSRISTYAASRSRVDLLRMSVNTGTLLLLRSSIWGRLNSRYRPRVHLVPWSWRRRARAG